MGKNLKERILNLNVNGIDWNACIVNYENSGSLSAVLAYTGAEGNFVALYCDKINSSDIEPTLPKILSCYKKK